jgi:hypothetical protein
MAAIPTGQVLDDFKVSQCQRRGMWPPIKNPRGEKPFVAGKNIAENLVAWRSPKLSAGPRPGSLARQAGGA